MARVLTNNMTITDTRRVLLIVGAYRPLRAHNVVRCKAPILVREVTQAKHLKTSHAGTSDHPEQRLAFQGASRGWQSGNSISLTHLAFVKKPFNRFCNFQAVSKVTALK